MTNAMALTQEMAVDPAAGTASAPAAPAPMMSLRFSFTGSGSEYFRIWIVNLVLTILTLGIYSAWAKVRREQFFHRHTQLAGCAFDYHGEPMRILKGRLLAWAALALVFLSQTISPLLYLGLLLSSVPLLPWLLLRSLKFRAATTSYRGLHFRHRGTYGQSLKAYVGHALPVVIGGLWFPMWQRAVRRFQLEYLVFGRSRFQCNPSVLGFYGTYIGASLLMVLLLLAFLAATLPFVARDGFGAGEMATAFGLMPLAVMVLAALFVRPFTKVQLANLTWNGTTLAGRRFVSDQRYVPFLAVTASNLALIVLTLGLYWPWAKVRETRYRLTHLAFETRSLDDFAGVRADGLSAAGEEIAEAFDLDFAL